MLYVDSDRHGGHRHLAGWQLGWMEALRRLRDSASDQGPNGLSNWGELRPAGASQTMPTHFPSATLTNLCPPAHLSNVVHLSNAWGESDGRVGRPQNRSEVRLTNKHQRQQPATAYPHNTYLKPIKYGVLLTTCCKSCRSAHTVV